VKGALLQQYLRVKAEHRDAVLLFRLGDFYEMFFDDAATASRVCDLTLTARNRGEPDEVPLCGFPAHASQPYIARLLAAGHAVAICEQGGQPRGRGIMEREVVRVITPGTILEEESFRALMDLPKRTFTDIDGNRQPFLTPNEVEALKIRRGSLSDKERREIESLRARYKALTAREREVLALVAAGLLNKVIADRLGIQETTIKVHRGRVMEKMRAASLADLVRISERLGLAPGANSARR